MCDIRFFLPILYRSERIRPSDLLFFNTDQSSWNLFLRCSTHCFSFILGTASLLLWSIDQIQISTGARSAICLYFTGPRCHSIYIGSSEIFSSRGIKANFDGVVSTVNNATISWSWKRHEYITAIIPLFVLIFVQYTRRAQLSALMTESYIYFIDANTTLACRLLARAARREEPKVRTCKKPYRVMWTIPQPLTR